MNEWGANEAQIQCAEVISGGGIGKTPLGSCYPLLHHNEKYLEYDEFPEMSC